MIAVIAGSTGLTGALLLSKLILDKDITQVISVSRRALPFTHPKLKSVIVSDFSHLLDHQGDLKGDLYFCALGTTIKEAKTKDQFRKVDYDAIVSFGKIAELHQAQSLVVISASGANAESPIFYNRVKGEAEASLLKLNLNRLVLMRPGLLIGERKASRPLEKFSIKTSQVISRILPKKMTKTFATSIEELAQRMIEEAKITTKETKIIGAVNI